MGFFDTPEYANLKAIRDSGHDGPLDQDLGKDVPLGTAEVLDALRRLGKRG